MESGKCDMVGGRRDLPRAMEVTGWVVVNLDLKILLGKRTEAENLRLVLNLTSGWQGGL